MAMATAGGAVGQLTEFAQTVNLCLECQAPESVFLFFIVGKWPRFFLTRLDLAQKAGLIDALRKPPQNIAARFSLVFDYLDCWHNIRLNRYVTRLFQFLQVLG